MLIYYENSKETGEYEKVSQTSNSGEVLVFTEDFTRSDAKVLVEKYNLKSGLIDDVFDMNELPRVEVDEGYQYIFLRNFEATPTKATSYPLLFVIGEKLFACLSANKIATDNLVTIPESNGKPVTHQRMLIRSILSITKHYEETIDVIGNKITSIERRMRSHEANNQDFFSFVNIEGSLNRAKMSLIGLSTVAEKLMPVAKTKSEREQYDDILLFAKQLLVEIDSHLQTIKSIREAYSTVVNNTLNQRMKLLTSLTLLLAIPNVFYSMYGMNINLPFMQEPWAYPVIVGFTIALIVFVYLIARRSRFF